MGVFARWVVGFGVFAVVFAFFGFGASVGWWGALCLTAPPWRSLGAHMPRVGALAWAVVLRAGLVGNVGAGHDCPAPCSVACGARLLRGVGREAWRVGCSQGANTSARTRREGGLVGRNVVAWLGAGVALACSPLGAYNPLSWQQGVVLAPLSCGACWVIARPSGEQCPPEGEQN